MIERGNRHTPRTDLALAEWQCNEFGVDVLMLSTCPSTGALSMALRTPAGLDYPEREHFYACDQDLFQFEGEFHHDEERRFFAGDYVYRPPGTVYGHSPGSDGGIIIASLNGRPERYHFDDHPPWQGEYLIDAAWQERAVQPTLVHSDEQQWQSTGPLAVKRLRGLPDTRSPEYGARVHSPWGADAACLLRYPGGFDGDANPWPGVRLESLVLSGQAVLNGEPWHRGCYGFDAFEGRLVVTENLVVYLRVFREPA